MPIVYSVLPGSSVQERKDELLSWVRERGLTSRVDLVTSDALASPLSGLAFESLQRVLLLDPERAAVGVYVLSGAYTNSSFARSHGIRAYGVSPFNVNIADAGTIHHVNERIILVFFLEGVDRMKRILREFATSPSSPGVPQDGGTTQVH